MRDGCAFCDYEGPSPILREFMEGGVFVIEPVAPVAAGHLLVVPRRHVGHGLWPSQQAIDALACAAQIGRELAVGGEAFNLIVSHGEAATQTVEHMHVHVVPRREGDRLRLPWSPSEQLALEALCEALEDAGLAGRAYSVAGDAGRRLDVAYGLACERLGRRPPWAP